jgi:ATP-dependent Clp protease ATP-binding subunit ClpC
VASLLESQGIDIQAMEKELTAPLGKTPPAEQKEMDFAPRSRKVIEQAFEEARKFNHRYLGSEHLFLSILSLKEGASHEGLLRCGINAEDVAAKFHEYFGA